MHVGTGEADKLVALEVIYRSRRNMVIIVHRFYITAEKERDVIMVLTVSLSERSRFI